MSSSTGPVSPAPLKKPHRPALWYRSMDASSLGIEIAVSVILFTALGMWLEAHVTHWAPWTSVLGMLVGAATAGRAVARTARAYTRQLREDQAYQQATARQELASADRAEHDPP